MHFCPCRQNAGDVGGNSSEPAHSNGTTPFRDIDAVRSIPWIVAVIALVLWTLLSAGGYAAVHGAAQWITQNADFVSRHPDVTSWLLWALDLVRDIGVFVLIGVWALVSAGIVLAAWMLQRGSKLLRVER